MNFHERIQAVLHRQRPDRVPFAPYDNLVYRGEFERRLRERGTGLVARRSSVRSDTPNVRVARHTDDQVHTTTWSTPAGEVSVRAQVMHDRRDVGGLNNAFMIKTLADYEPVIFLIDDTVYYPNYSSLTDTVRDLGGDGIVRGRGVQAPYHETESLFGIPNWIYEQHDHPEAFERLLAALRRRTDRVLPLILDAPIEFVDCGSINGNYGPRQMERFVVPFYKEMVPRLHEAGKICSIHAHSSNLASLKGLVAELGIDVIEAFTPPPIGDLSVADARAAWGNETVIWVNFPETIFWYGPEQTRQYTLDLLRSDPDGPLVIGMTEMGLQGVTDAETEKAFKAGMLAILDAIDEAGAR